jgi:hypothetical protein
VPVARVAEPPLSDDITTGNLDPEVRRDLRGLQKDTANSVARHLVAAGLLVDEDPELALEHARFARTRASRIAVVREAAGITAYHAGEWAEALGELRAARRMGGGPGHLAVMADIERALGRPERALDLSRGPEVRELDRAERIELLIVAAGARRDLGEIDAAVVSLQVPELDPARRDPWSARLFYAHADNLLAAGRESDALEWFVHAANADADGETDADLRIAELTGDPLPDEDVEFGAEEFDESGGAPVGEVEPQRRRGGEPAARADEAEAHEEPAPAPVRPAEDALRTEEPAEGGEEVLGGASAGEVEPEGLRGAETAAKADEAEGRAESGPASVDPVAEESDALPVGEPADAAKEGEEPLGGASAGEVEPEDRRGAETAAKADEVEGRKEPVPASVHPAESDAPRDGEPADGVDEAESDTDRAAEAEGTATPPPGSGGEDAPGEDAVREAATDEAGEVPAEGAEVVDPEEDVRDAGRDAQP